MTTIEIEDVDHPTLIPTQSSTVSVLDIIKSTHREREDLLRPEGDMTRRILAVCRNSCNGDKIAGQRLAKSFEKGECAPPSTSIIHLLAARETLRAARKERERKLVKLAKSLPVWSEWAEGIRGLGALGLGQIVGECGDLNNYSTPAKLWKRMGLAVMPDGTRQRRVKDQDAEIHGYSPRRRAVMAVIGISMVMQKGDYYELYINRKEYEEIEALVGGIERTPKHIDNRARRYMQKRILRDLWRAWRRQSAEVERVEVERVESNKTVINNKAITKVARKRIGKSDARYIPTADTFSDLVVST
jgi:hypothetical protein